MMSVDPSSEEDSSTSSRTPLLSIGLAILAVLMVPVFLYSIGPDGPVKVGDVVFATDIHRVRIMDTDGADVGMHSAMCVLEPRIQLVVQKMGTPSEGWMIAEPVSLAKENPPFCYTRRPVVVPIR